MPKDFSKDHPVRQTSSPKIGRSIDHFSKNECANVGIGRVKETIHKMKVIEIKLVLWPFVGRRLLVTMWCRSLVRGGS